MFDCCIERVNVVVARSPAAVHQPHTYTVTWSTAAVVSLLVYCCISGTDFETARLSGCFCKNTALLDHLVCL